MTTNLHNVAAASGEVLAEELQISQRQAVSLLANYVKARAVAADAKRDQDGLGAQLKGYLEAHRGEELHDGERDITARLQRRRGADRWDVMSMPDDLVLRLKALGALSIDKDVLKALIGKSGDADAARRYAIPGGETTALIVTENGH